jgi:hypothetical protein
MTFSGDTNLADYLNEDFFDWDPRQADHYRNGRGRTPARRTGSITTASSCSAGERPRLQPLDCKLPGEECTGAIVASLEAR